MTGGTSSSPTTWSRRAHSEIDAAQAAHSQAIFIDPALAAIAHDYLRDVTNMWAAASCLPNVCLALENRTYFTTKAILEELDTMTTHVPDRANRIAYFRLNPSIETLRRIWIR